MAISSFMAASSLHGDLESLNNKTKSSHKYETCVKANFIAEQCQDKALLTIIPFTDQWSLPGDVWHLYNKLRRKILPLYTVEHHTRLGPR